MRPLTNHDESESGLSDTPPGHRAGSPSLLTLLGPHPKAAAGFSADMTTASWGDLPDKDREWSEGAPYVLDCTTPTYQSRGVSPVPDGTLHMEVELWTRIWAYEWELQTLHAVEQRPDMRQFVDNVLRDNPAIFSDPKFTTLARANLVEDPQREIITAILATATLCLKPMTPSPSAPASPAPLMVPPPSWDTAPPSTDNEEEGPESCSTTPSPAPSTRSRE
jgi:hypothetical protein